MNTVLGIAIGILLAALVILGFFWFEAPTHPSPCQIFEVCEAPQ